MGKVVVGGGVTVGTKIESSVGSLSEGESEEMVASSVKSVSVIVVDEESEEGAASEKRLAMIFLTWA